MRRLGLLLALVALTGCEDPPPPRLDGCEYTNGLDRFGYCPHPAHRMYRGDVTLCYCGPDLGPLDGGAR